MKSLNHKLGMAIVFAVLCSLILASMVVFSSTPGTDQDPLVTLSFLEKRLDETAKNLTTQIADLKAQVSSLRGSSTGSGTTNSSTVSGTGSGVFTMIEANKGQFLYLGDSAEVILRGGKVTVIATASGGLADLTAGKDLMMNQVVPSNHLILVPKNDGRGLVVLEKSWLLIKGTYTLTQ